MADAEAVDLGVDRCVCGFLLSTCTCGDPICRSCDPDGCPGLAVDRRPAATADYSLNYVWDRNRVIVHVDRELSPQSALDLADGLRYFAERASVVTPSRTDRQPPASASEAKGGKGTSTGG